jgi:malonate-semialdehyde dehydrogenase (acetylating)/methylmalonate-semialdehyde dehydrogenase
MASVPTLPNFINGKFVQVDRPTVNVVSPATGETLCQVPLSTAADLDEAVAHAQAAFEVWSNVTIKQRAAIMFRFHSLVEAHSEELAGIIVRENGKNFSEALADVAKGNETAEWATSLPQLACGKKLEVSKGIHCEEIRKPLGVVGAIVPFNFPLMVPFWTIPIALTLGNCVILKPSEKVPCTMQRVCELFIQAGMPPGVFQVVHGAVEVVTSMCAHKGISAVSFVGSSKVAEIVATSCRQRNKRVLALGGAKNHLVALQDCDTGMAARDIVASFAGCAGQRCMAASVLIVVGENDALIEQVVAAASALVPGQAAGQVGPVIDGIAQARILKYINEAEKVNGAKVLLDGRSWAAQRTAGFWVGPTILLHQNKRDPAVLDEIFGPVLSVVQVDTFEEALEIENSNPYGNAASVYTERGANAEFFTRRFNAAMLGVNIGIPVPREPFSFGGLYGTASKFGDCDVTGDGALEFFTNRIKITSKWTSSYSTATARTAVKRPLPSQDGLQDKANFDGRM